MLNKYGFSMLEYCQNTLAKCVRHWARSCEADLSSRGHYMRVQCEVMLTLCVLYKRLKPKGESRRAEEEKRV